jgi:hypothetical protein
MTPLRGVRLSFVAPWVPPMVNNVATLSGLNEIQQNIVIDVRTPEGREHNGGSIFLHPLFASRKNCLLPIEFCLFISITPALLIAN